MANDKTDEFLAKIENMSREDLIELSKALHKVNDKLREENGELREKALTDSLTGLPNRRGLRGDIDGLTSDKESFSVVLGDIDNFKEINDTYGHDMGDKVLIEVGQIILASVRGSDTAGRLGGDEFQMLLKNCDVDNAQVKVETIREKIEDTVHIKFGLQEPVTMSFGIAFCNQEDCDYPTAKKRADVALYESKVERNSVGIYKKH